MVKGGKAGESASALWGQAEQRALVLTLLVSLPVPISFLSVALSCSPAVMTSQTANEQLHCCNLDCLTYLGFHLSVITDALCLLPNTYSMSDGMSDGLCSGVTGR